LIEFVAQAVSDRATVTFHVCGPEILVREPSRANVLEKVAEARTELMHSVNKRSHSLLPENHDGSCRKGEAPAKSPWRPISVRKAGRSAVPAPAWPKCKHGEERLKLHFSKMTCLP